MLSQYKIANETETAQAWLCVSVRHYSIPKQCFFGVVVDEHHAIFSESNNNFLDDFKEKKAECKLV